MSAIHSIAQPDGALAELHTDEPLDTVIASMRAHGVTGCHVEVRGRRRWLVADKVPSYDYTGTLAALTKITELPPDDYPHTRTTDREPDERTAPWWVVVVPIVALVALMVVVGVVL